MASNVRPITKSIYVCDEVVADPSSGKVSLLGVFNAVRPVSAYPYRLGRLCVVLQFTDGFGDFAVQVEIVAQRISGRSPSPLVSFSRGIFMSPNLIPCFLKLQLATRISSWLLPDLRC